MHLSKFSETTGLHTLLYSSLIAEADSNSFSKLGRTAVIPLVTYLNTHGAKEPDPGPPWHILAMNSCPILLILPSAMLNIPQNERLHLIESF